MKNLSSGFSFCVSGLPEQAMRQGIVGFYLQVILLLKLLKIHW